LEDFEKPGGGQESRGKGKRGGVRIIYFYALSAGVVALIDIYSKAEKKDLNEVDKKWLKRELAEIKGAL
jgi:mRNA-degrading endonuclease RelE of RelBE toxin-antitoxin system